MKCKKTRFECMDKSQYYQKWLKINSIGMHRNHVWESFDFQLEFLIFRIHFSAHVLCVKSLSLFFQPVLGFFDFWNHFTISRVSAFRLFILHWLPVLFKYLSLLLFIQYLQYCIINLFFTVCAADLNDASNHATLLLLYF